MKAQIVLMAVAYIVLLSSAVALANRGLGRAKNGDQRRLDRIRAKQSAAWDGHKAGHHAGSGGAETDPYCVPCQTARLHPQRTTAHTKTPYKRADYRRRSHDGA